MIKEINDDILALIARVLAESENTADALRLMEWIEQSPNNKRYFEQIKNIWDANDEFQNLSHLDTSKALEKVHERIKRKTNFSTFWDYWQKIAAILFIPLLSVAFLWLYYNSQKIMNSDEIVYNEVYTSIGTRSSLILADSTLVWLNSGSSLYYPNKFVSNKRKVFLKGEAYFEVKSDNSKPFLVETPTLLVKAVGTRFNVCEYTSDSISEVTLVSGKIFINANDFKSDKINGKLVELNPNQHLNYNKATSVINVNNCDIYKYIAWKDGKLIFRDEPLDRVINRLGMIFNVDIEIYGEELKDYRYHATFQDESFEEILKLLKISSPIDFCEVQRNLLPDGSYSRKKVIIFPSNKRPPVKADIN